MSDAGRTTGDAFTDAGWTIEEMKSISDQIPLAEKMDAYQHPDTLRLQHEIDARLDRQGLTEQTHEEGQAQYRAAHPKA